MLKHRFLFMPFLIFFSAFLLDKILLLESIQTYFSKTMSEVNFILKPELYQELKTYLQTPKRKKVLVYFGNSRALLFTNEYIEKKYPQWILFNFSVPGGTPDYAKFWLEKFKTDNIKPDFVLLDHSIEAYNADNKLNIDEVLVNGLDFSFLIRHINRYSSREISDFVAKQMFQLYKYRPKISTIKERIANDSMGLKLYREWRNDIKNKIRKERGSASPALHTTSAYTPDEELKKLAEGDFQMYLGSFRLKTSTLKFQQENIAILKEMQIPFATIWVRLSDPYLNLIMTRKITTDAGNTTAYNAWIGNIRKLDADFWDMNLDPEYKCNKFSDAGHMAPACYPDYTDFIFNRLGTD